MMREREFYLNKVEALGQLSAGLQVHVESMFTKIDEVRTVLHELYSSDSRIVSSESSPSLSLPVTNDVSETEYCLCGKPSYGDMIECEDPGCILKWFHFECVGLEAAPSTVWICPICCRH